MISRGAASRMGRAIKSIVESCHPALGEVVSAAEANMFLFHESRLGVTQNRANMTFDDATHRLASWLSYNVISKHFPYSYLASTLRCFYDAGGRKVTGSVSGQILSWCLKDYSCGWAHVPHLPYHPAICLISAWSANVSPPSDLFAITKWPHGTKCSMLLMFGWGPIRLQKLAVHTKAPYIPC